jgi:hypothetical protein
MALLVAMGYLLEWSSRPPLPSAESASEMYRLVDAQTNRSVGSWQIVGGRSTLILRDGMAIPRLILQADPEEGGKISLQDAKGQWHHFPASPSD